MPLPRWAYTPGGTGEAEADYDTLWQAKALVPSRFGDFVPARHPALRYGITLNDVKLLIRPKDERMRELISLRAFGLSELDAVRYYVAMKMAERGLVSAPNIAVGQPFNIGITSQTSPVAIMPSMTDLNGGIAPVPAPTTQPRA